MQEAVFVDLNMKDKIIIIDDQGVNVTVDSKSFLKHIQKYHNTGISIHEQNGHYFTVDDSFRKMLKEKFPFSELIKKKVNTLIFPNLESANITYKILKELNGAQSIGPILLGLEQSVHILQLGATVDEIVNMSAVAVVDAQHKEKLRKKKKNDYTIKRKIN